jgi:hypothetical protein
MPETDRRTAAQALVDATVRLAGEGLPLMMRVAPPGGAFVVWDHYPPDDCVDRLSGCRWFYHAHPEGEREGGEHGHFHLFFDRNLFRGRANTPLAGPPGGRSSGADIVHLIAIAIGVDGLPMRLFTVNRWVTDEWLYPAPAIERRLARFDLARADGDRFVNAWLTAAMAFFRPQVAAALVARDATIAGWDGQDLFEDREREVLSSVPIDINDAVAALG